MYLYNMRTRKQDCTFGYSYVVMIPVICLLTLIHRYSLNQKQFRLRGYLWISVSKKTDNRSRHVRVFSSRDEFLVLQLTAVRGSQLTLQTTSTPQKP